MSLATREYGRARAPPSICGRSAWRAGAAIVACWLLAVPVLACAQNAPDLRASTGSVGVAGANGGAGVAPSGGGSGGAGDNAPLVVGGALSATAPGVEGVQASSTGGAGGKGGSAYAAGNAAAGGAGGAGGSASVQDSASVSIGGSLAYGLEADSAGGAGGEGGSAFGLGGNGGRGGSGGGGGLASVRFDGTLTTSGLDSFGIGAFSSGGSGGEGGPSKGLGGNGGTGGPGGEGGGDAASVSVTNSGNISTLGAVSSAGIEAQSVGGGGGSGGGAVTTGTGFSLSFGGSGGSGGSGGPVQVLLNNSVAAQAAGYSIATAGELSPAVQAQSIGGGGGSGGFAVANNLGGPLSVSVGSAGDGGSGNVGGNVLVQAKGSLITAGAESDAILAQSLGGGGGAGGMAESSATLGGVSMAFAVGGSGGIVVSAAGSLGVAIDIPHGTASITNDAQIVGRIELPSGTNQLLNSAGAVLGPSGSVQLGAGTLQNSGTLSPGGVSVVGSTTLQGNLTQSSSGRLLFDIGPATPAAVAARSLLGVTPEAGRFASVATPMPSDFLQVDGNANLQGAVQVHLMNAALQAGSAVPGVHRAVLLSSTGTLDTAGLALQAPDTSVASYALVYPGSHSIVLQQSVDFLPAGLYGDAAQVAGAVQRIQLGASNPALQPLAASLFAQPNLASLQSAYSQLAGQGPFGLEQLDLDSNARMRTSLRDELRRELACDCAPRAWATLISRGTSIDGNPATGAAGIFDRVFGAQIGRARRIGRHALAGVSLGATSGSFTMSGLPQSGRTNSLRVGGFAGWRGGPYDASAMIGFSGFENQESRTVLLASRSLGVGASATVPGIDETPSGGNLATAVDAEADGGYSWRSFGQRLRAFGGGGLVALHERLLTEGGGAGTALVYPAAQVDWRAVWAGIGWRHGSTCRRIDLNMRVQHAWLPPDAVTAMFAAAPGTAFTVYGVRQAANTLRTSLGIRRCLRRGISWYAAVRTVVARGERAMGVDGGLQWRW